MKKIILLSTVFMVLCFTSRAQIKKGNFIVRGSLGVRYTETLTTDTLKQTSLFIVPALGYFINDFLVLGLSVNLNTSIRKNERLDEKVVINRLIIGPFVRIYHPRGLFAEATFGIGLQKVKISTPGTTGFNPNILSWGLGAGYAIFLNKHVAIEPLIRYTFTQSKTDAAKVNENLFLFLVGFNIYLGDKD